MEPIEAGHMALVLCTCEEEDFLDEAAPRGRRARGGPSGAPLGSLSSPPRTDVTFSVFVHPAPAAGETVCLSGTIAELTNPLPMQQNPTGDGRLWHLTVQVNAASIVPPPAQQAPAAMIGLMMAGSVLGGSSRGPAAAPTFEYSGVLSAKMGADSENRCVWPRLHCAEPYWHYSAERRGAEKW